MSYKAYKTLSVSMNVFMIPIGTLTGYLLGTGEFFKAVIALSIQMLLVFIQSSLWYKSMELMKGEQ